MKLRASLINFESCPQSLWTSKGAYTMGFAVTVAEQVVIMFLLIAVGFFMFRIKMVDTHTMKHMTDVLLYIVTPAILFNSFTIERTDELLKSLLLAFALAIVSYLCAFAVAYLLVRKKGNPHAAIERFAIIYPNNGFMGIPLVAAVFGETGILYATAYICIGNIFTWTHGVSLIIRSRNQEGNREKFKMPLSQLLLSPPLLSFFVGFLVFLLRIPIPGTLQQGIQYIASLNTPLAMIIVGTNLAQTPILSAFRSPRLYWVVFLINLAVPCVILALFSFLPFSTDLLINNIILSACPSAAMTIIFAEKYKNDVEYATRLFTLSSLMTLITLPLIMTLTSLCLGG